MVLSTSDEAVEANIKISNNQIATQTQVQVIETMSQTVTRPTIDRAVDAAAKPILTQTAIQTENKQLFETDCQTERQLMIDKSIDAAVRPVITEIATTQTDEGHNMHVETTNQPLYQTVDRPLGSPISNAFESGRQLTSSKKASDQNISPASSSIYQSTPRGSLVRSKIAMWESTSPRDTSTSMMNNSKNMNTFPISPTSIKSDEDTKDVGVSPLTAASITSHNTRMSEILPTTLPRSEECKSRRNSEQGTPKNRLSDFMASFKSTSDGEHNDKVSVTSSVIERPSSVSRVADFIATFPPPLSPSNLPTEQRPSSAISHRPRSLLSAFLNNTSPEGEFRVINDERPASFSA
eukprot:CAMPEP_0197310082 /NCGR_PEP_ID=MMETSP0891-20130614/8707_1 /TAXON_ID=44058 ORGANISM="Aureoumbra lagunensis, Strain CCMP1510" /NCGR_SAMPLE_ID=MMETSP0891 /ASSEMBLY_ACC=CAM_ASM_000534 /LENGTH=350 /DNA_ID=CAMNT_0042795557 /DNA_START=113 /DNA_END=1165 /DNA_ORIENTATION=-